MLTEQIQLLKVQLLVSCAAHANRIEVASLLFGQRDPIDSHPTLPILVPLYTSRRCRSPTSNPFPQIQTRGAPVVSAYKGLLIYRGIPSKSSFSESVVTTASFSLLNIITIVRGLGARLRARPAPSPPLMFGYAVYTLCSCIYNPPFIKSGSLRY